MPSAKQEDVEKLAKEIDRVGQLAESAARLGLQTSHRYGVDNAKRSVVVFLRDEPKAELAEKWKVWQTNAQLPPEQRPTEKPPPWRHQVGQWLAQYITAGMAQSMDETVQGILKKSKSWVRPSIIAHTKIPRKGTTLYGPLSCCSKTRKLVTESAKISSPRCLPVSVELNQSVFALRVTSLRALRTNAWSYWGLSLKVGQKVSAAHPNANRHTPAPPADKPPPARDAEGLRFLR